MAIENNIIKSPVHLAANVARLLQTNKMDVVSLCTHPNINMWARYKPFPRSFDKATFKQDTDSNYHDRDDALAAANYGIGNIPYNDFVADMLEDAKAGFPTLETSRRYVYAPVQDDESWVYIHPSSTQPKTMGDFLNYYHNAYAPFGKLESKDIAKSLSGQMTINYSTQYEDGMGLTLTLKDFTLGNIQKPLGDYYLGVCFYNADNHYYMTSKINVDGTGDIKIDEIYTYGTRFFVDGKNIPNGNYSVFLFASNYVIPFGTSFATRGKYVPFPFTFDTFTLTQKEIQIVASFTPYRQRKTNEQLTKAGEILLVANITNKYTETITITHAYVYCLDSNGTTLFSTEFITGNPRILAEQTFSKNATIATANIVSQNALSNAVSCRFEIQLTVGGSTTTKIYAADIQTLDELPRD